MDAAARIAELEEQNAMLRALIMAMGEKLLILAQHLSRLAERKAARER